MGACATKPAVLKDAETEGAPAPEVKAEEAAPAVSEVKEVVVIEEEVISIVADASIDIKPRSLSNLFEEGEIIKEATGEAISVEPEIKAEETDQKLPVHEKASVVAASSIIEEPVPKITKEKEPVVVFKEKEVAVIEEKPKTETNTKEKEPVVVQVKPTAEKVTEPVVVPVKPTAEKVTEPVVEIKAAIITTEVKTINPVDPKSETQKTVDTKPPAAAAAVAAAVEVKKEITEKTGDSQQKTEVKPVTVVVGNEKK